MLAVTLAVIFGVMLAELRVSNRHEARLLARGATIPTGDVWPLMAIVYPLSFILMGAEGLWREGHGGSTAALSAPNWFAAGLLLFGAGKALKFWAIGTLGERWTFHVMVLPDAPLITNGPYRYVTHPNYLGVVGELAGTAMMMGAIVTGPIMTVLFGFVLLARIRFENRILEAIRARPSS